jgi:hypothetical protein
MADLASIGIALGSVKTLLDLAKNAQDVHLAMKINTELANIQGQLIDVQQKTLEIQQENQHTTRTHGAMKIRFCRESRGMLLTGRLSDYRSSGVARIGRPDISFLILCR